MIYQFHALLEGSSPRMWRRFLISADDNAADLMHTLMTMFMMDGYHLYHLEVYVPGMSYGANAKYETRSQIENSDDFQIWGPVPFAAEDYKISDLVRNAGEQLRFFYDYGDDWTIRLKLEDILDDEKHSGLLPYVLKGKGAGIIEDCGGVWALNDMMQEEKEFGVSEDEESILEFDKDTVNIALGSESL